MKCGFSLESVFPTVCFLEQVSLFSERVMFVVGKTGSNRENCILPHSWQFNFKLKFSLYFFFFLFINCTVYLQNFLFTLQAFFLNWFYIAKRFPFKQKLILHCTKYLNCVTCLRLKIVVLILILWSTMCRERF